MSEAFVLKPKPPQFQGDDAAWEQAQRASHARRQAQASAKAGKQEQVIHNTVKKIPFKSHFNRNQVLNAAGSLAVAGGVGGLVHHRREQQARVTKREQRNKTNTALGAAAGVAGVDAAYVVGGQSAKARIKINEAKRGKTNAQQDRWADHKKWSGMKAGEQIKGSTPASVKHKLFAHYPKDLPGWKAQRVLGWKNNNKVYAGALAAGAAAGGAFGGRKINKGKVGKAQVPSRLLNSTNPTVRSRAAHLNWRKRNGLGSHIGEGDLTPIRNTYGLEDKLSVMSGRLVEGKKASLPKSLRRERYSGFQKSINRFAAVGALTGTGGLGTAAAVRDRDKNISNEIAGSTVGGWAGQGAYQGAGYAAKWRAQAKYEKNPKSFIRHPKTGEKIQRTTSQVNASTKKVKAEHGFRSTGYSRNYPKNLPEARTHRILGWTHRGKTGTALGGAITLGGTYAGARVVQSKNGSKVRKNMKALPPGSPTHHRVGDEGVGHIIPPGSKGYHGRFEHAPDFEEVHENWNDVKAKRAGRIRAGKKAYLALGGAVAAGAGVNGLLAHRLKNQNVKLKAQIAKGVSGAGRDVFMHTVNPNRHGVHDIRLPKGKQSHFEATGRLWQNADPETKASVLLAGAAAGGVPAGLVGSHRQQQQEELKRKLKVKQTRQARMARQNVTKAEYQSGVQSTRVSPLRATEAAIGVSVATWGGSRLGIVRSALKVGMRKPGNAGINFARAERLRAAAEAYTGRGAAMLQSHTGVGFRLRPIEGVVGGALLTNHAVPIRRKQFTPTQQGGY